MFAHAIICSGLTNVDSLMNRKTVGFETQINFSGWKKKLKADGGVLRLSSDTGRNRVIQF